MSIFHYDEEKAQRVIDFISELRHTKGKWAGVQWQWIPWQKEDLIKPLFGMVDEKGNRQYRTCYTELPKKMGKSEIGAAIALYLLIADNEQGAEIYGAAGDREQAGIVYDVAANMVEQDFTLNNNLTVLRSTKRIVSYERNSFYRAISAESYTKHGYSVHGCIFDEMHVQKNRMLYDTLKDGAGDARDQPLMFIITTAGIHDVNSIAWEIHEYARKVKEGIIKDERYLSIMYCLPMDADWEDEENWKKVNPSLGYTVTIDKLRDAYQEVKNIPAKQNNFRRLRLNQWVSQTTRWLDIAFWDKCDSPLNKQKLQGLECWAGLDMSSSIDITALVLVFPRENGFYDILPFFWVPEERIEQRVYKDKVPYDVWIREGYIYTTSGDEIGIDFIEKKIVSLYEIYNIRAVNFDRWGAKYISQRLHDQGITVLEFGQGFKSMSYPTKEFQRIVMKGKIRHGGNPVMRWMFDNIAMETDAAENIKITKKKSTDRVDGMVALVMGLDGALRVENEKSMYEDEGIFTIGGEENKVKEEVKEE